ncbi:putative quinol monooxygenase [Portibacter marinus]|uniref:putative quinol monooxygenase n=1 Tax=Portibacter marinus TaxID=2898660 RepID=UPI001F1D1BC6|nr:antibiotic biosynthesis monooxygenase [Portibacter marinus]
MIKRIVKLTFREEHRQDFKEIFQEHRQKMLENEICSSLEVLEDIKEKGLFFTISTWDSEDALQQYRSSSYFEDIWGKVKPWFKARAEAWSLR